MRVSRLARADLGSGGLRSTAPTPSSAADQLARLLVAGRRPAAVEALTEIDWPDVAGLARAEGVAGLLLAALDTGLPVGPPPEPVLRQLRQERYQAIAANTLMRDETARILRALQAEAIPVLLLKGAALQETLYPGLDLRRMGDIDLLVHPEHAPTAMDTLRDLGFRRCSPELWPGSDLRFENETVFERPAPARVLVELHWRLIDSPHYQERIDMDAFWKGARTLDVDGARGLAMRREALLLYLCTHLELHHAKDRAPHLRWLHDVWALLAQDGDTIDWTALLRTAADSGLRIPFARALERVAEPPWLAAVPESAREATARELADASEVRRHRHGLRAHAPAARLWHDLTGMRGWRRRGLFLLCNLFPSPTYMRSRYQPANTPALLVAYPRRWAIGLLQLVRGLQRSTSSDHASNVSLA